MSSSAGTEWDEDPPSTVVLHVFGEVPRNLHFRKLFPRLQAQHVEASRARAKALDLTMMERSCPPSVDILPTKPHPCQSTLILCENHVCFAAGRPFALFLFHQLFQEDSCLPQFCRCGLCIIHVRRQQELRYGIRVDLASSNKCAHSEASKGDVASSERLSRASWTSRAARPWRTLVSEDDLADLSHRVIQWVEC